MNLIMKLSFVILNLMTYLSLQIFVMYGLHVNNLDKHFSLLKTLLMAFFILCPFILLIISKSAYSFFPNF